MTKTEAQTRSELIDNQLAQSGWNVKDPTQVIEEFDILTPLPDGVAEPHTPYEGHQFSDYVLLGKDRKPLAVVEAKKSSQDAAIGREQAKQYCYNIQKQLGGELPFCFYTNGHDIYFWDLDNYPPRKVVGFPTRDDLERFQYIRRNRKPLTQELINTAIAGRDYQIRAMRAVLEGIEQKKCDFLLVMATGTGKTRTCIAMVDALMRAGHAEKILFLVDRIALREQALAAFKEHLPHEPRWPNVGEKLIAKDRRIYVSTYPTMLNIIRDELQHLSPHFFDCIVVDESHRSIYNTYKEVLDYFKTITLGLTATPTGIIDHNTFQLFHCEDGIPTFAYTFEEAVNNVPPYLCSFQVMKIQTRFQVEGISKRTISLEDQKKLLLEGKEIEEINFEGSQLEKQVINKGTNTLIVKEFMEECIKDPNGVLPGKTIFFCSSKAHARRIEEIFDKLYPQYKGELAKVLISDDPRVYGKGGLLDQFTNNDMPRVAISVDMLDTGIDVREIVNLVFAKPVYSYTKFWQMIGRGTRLLETSKSKPWCPEKDVFLILDCWDNFEYFKLHPKGKELKPQLPLPVRLAGLRLDKIEKAIDLGQLQIAERETTKFRQQISQLPQSSVIIIRRSIVVDESQIPAFGSQDENRPESIEEIVSNHPALSIIEDESPSRRYRLNLVQLLDGSDTTDKIIPRLTRCATCWYLHEASDTLYLDYFVNEATRQAFRENFDFEVNQSPIELFQAFQVLLTLNLFSASEDLKKDLYQSDSLYVSETVPILAADERIMGFKDFWVTKTDIDEPVLLKSFSDGEHQLLHALGLCLLFKNTQSLFLLDEPETHFNPDWRANFVTRLHQSFNGSDGHEMLVTTHTPFLISDSRPEKVLVFNKADGVVSVYNPDYNTLGASINKITMATFGKRETIGGYAQTMLEGLRQRFKQGEDKDQLIAEINRQLGDSVEKVLLIKTILDSME